MTDATQIPPSTTPTVTTKAKRFPDLKFDFPAMLATMMTGLFAAVTLASGFTHFQIDADIKQTLFALTALTWGYYFGSSTGSKSKDAPMIASALAQSGQSIVPTVSVPSETTITTTGPRA